jgi:acyl-ACP thioesterase
MDDLVYTIKFKVKGHDVNSNKFLTIPALIKNMQEASFQHARKLKTSVWDMAEDKMTWVLVRKEIKIITPLKLDNTYTILTYPSGFDKFLAYRDYLIFDSDKNLVVGASSTWTLLHTESRKLLKIPQKILDIGVPKKIRFLSQPEKSIVISDELQICERRKVRPYDLDWNNHINNIVLVRFIMEAIKSKGIEDERILKILMHFKNELILNESVDIYLSETENGYLSILKEVETSKDIVMCNIIMI